MIGQLLIAGPIVANVSVKAAIFHHSLNGRRMDNMKQTLLDFNFSLLKEEKEKNKQKSKRTKKRWCQWRKMVGRLMMFRWALQCWFHQLGKVPNFVVS